MIVSLQVPTVLYVSETRTWNVSQISRIQELEKRYLRGACGVNRMDDGKEIM